MKEIFDIRPQLTEEEFGPEPSLRMLLQWYYADYSEKPLELTEEYLNNLLQTYEKENVGD